MGNSDSKYGKYDFCKDVGCQMMVDNGSSFECPMSHDGCMYTARQFREWIDKNGFEIVKKK